MAYGIVHHFPGGTREQYEASIAAVHPDRNTLPKGQIFHAAGPSNGGWTIIAVHESKESWEQFRDAVLLPRFEQGIKGGFAAMPQEIAFDVSNLQQDQRSQGNRSASSAEAEVREASRRFYDALNRMASGKARSFDDIWSQETNVTTMHPIAGRQVGWEAVRESFEQFAQIASRGTVVLKDQVIRVSGDMAYELGIEQGSVTLAGERADFDHRVTNIYERGAGGWKMVHHHGDVDPALVEALDRLRAAAAGAAK
ncbi:MAG: YybH family protein [Bacteroidales bacterium]